MRLKKEFILVIVIIILIFFIEWVTNLISKNSVQKISDEIFIVNEELEYARHMKDNNILNDDIKNTLKTKIEKLRKDWMEEQDKLSIFAEHDELEKATKCIVVLEENSKNEEYDDALEDSKEFIYWLNHFKEKDNLEWKNIF